MTSELESLVKKFESHRSRSPEKVAHYPPRLAKAAISFLNAGLPAKDIAKSLRISVSSLLAWRKKYGAGEPPKPDFIPVCVETSPAGSPSGAVSIESVAIKIVFVEMVVPADSVASTIKNVTILARLERSIHFPLQGS